MFENAKYLSENEKNALVEIQRQVKFHYPDCTFLLFGSKARGDFRQDSDIDLLILTEQKLSWREMDDVISRVYEVNLSFGTLFTAHSAVRSEWDQGLWTCLPLKQSIENESVPV
jgi:predicted nucleotidyltransferase